jgi:23S rRNA (uracil1939-C5)-methyltransferase
MEGPAVAKEELYDVEMITHAYGGDCMGRLADGRAVFVPGTMPGELVRIRLVEQKRSFARGVVVEILRSAAERVSGECPSPASCGGCHYMHMTYPAQLQAKTDVLRDQLKRIAGISSPEVAPIIPSAREWHYRNAVQFHLNEQGQLGFQEPGSHRVFPVEGCLLCEPAIEAILPALDFQGISGLERIQVRAGVEDDILLVLESNDPVPPEISIELPASVVFVGPGGFEENQALVLAGDEHLVMQAAGRDFRVSAGSFFQVNTQQAENMLQYLLTRLPLSASSTVLEVYGGVGLFSAFLAPRVARLVVVESAPSAIDDFAANLDEFENVELYDGLAEEILPVLDCQPDVVLVDPPRAGLALPALDALLRMNPQTLAYVSCDPATLARDAKRLLAAGYHLRSVQPFDMFPQTYHIESISIFRLGSK